jgi:hypothetical protein
MFDCLVGRGQRKDHPNMKNQTLVVTLAGVLLLFTSGVGSAAQIGWTGVTNLSDSSQGIPWVFGSTMWESLDTGVATGASQTGFTYFDTHDIGLFTFTFGDLELSSYLSPGAALPGFEIYTDTDAVFVPFDMLQDGVLVASGEADFLRVDVLNNADANALGTAEATITTAGGDPAFFNELMTLSGGTGKLSITIDSFNPVAIGVFNNVGTIAILPAPALAGDLNADGFVGIADLNIVLGVWNTNVTPGDLLAGDPSGDGFVGIADLNVVLGNWNAGTPPGDLASTSIPEPGTLILLGACCAVLFRRGVLLTRADT